MVFISRLFSEICIFFLFLLLRAVYTNHFAVASFSDYNKSSFLNSLKKILKVIVNIFSTQVTVSV